MAHLPDDHYVSTQILTAAELLKYIEQERQQIDCLVLQADGELPNLIQQILQCAIAIPTVILRPHPGSLESDQSRQSSLDHHPGNTSNISFNSDQISKIRTYIDQAISQFVTHAVTLNLQDFNDHSHEQTELNHFIVSKQRQLAKKLQERLGYLGVYYKRDQKSFLRNLSPVERQKFLDQLKSKYRQIVLSYFADNKRLNDIIDEYVNAAFFADIPVTRIVEIHMELMDDFSKQLKLEGRSEEVLLDYRLTLIDTIAHLCEMYRRSIPRDS